MTGSALVGNRGLIQALKEEEEEEVGDCQNATASLIYLLTKCVNGDWKIPQIYGVCRSHYSVLLVLKRGIWRS